jgi:hypothetical protein
MVSLVPECEGPRGTQRRDEDVPGRFVGKLLRIIMHEVGK